MGKYYFTSESVGIGHPDKVCDRVSDSILDARLSQDEGSRVAIETLVTTQFATIAGEVTTKAKVDFEGVARKAIRDIGYREPALGFDYENADVVVKVHEQSPDISQGVTEGSGLFKAQGAGDQGIMFGYAVREGEEYMPLAICLSHKLVKAAKEERESRRIPYLKPDCKSQVTIEYDGNTPRRIDAIVLSLHHAESAGLEEIVKDAKEKIITPICGNLMDENTKILVNPTGRFVIGGPCGDTGVTGRKIIVDSYGGYAKHGGGAFSGKDPTKVDRSAAYAARWVAKNIVAAELADKCEIQLSYAIGYPDPLNITIETFGTGKIEEERISKAVRDVFDLTPRGIIDALNLRKPIYARTSFGGHFGQKPEGDYFSWERTNKVEELRKAAGLV